MAVVKFSELDNLLKHFDDGYEISHDEAYRRFAESHLLPPDDLPSDPFSEQYAARYLELYKKISSRVAYSPQNERSEFNVDELTFRPFPYFTHSLKLASLHYTLIGKLFEIMDLKENSDILECGFGWGNTTLALAMLGHNITAVDIEERYCELVRRRAEMLHVDSITLINSDFLWVETTDKQFDAIFFFESFHHCWEFQRLLRALHRVLRPGGKVYFGAEPINKDFTVPWGVRLDGESLFVARKSGWMELGFRSDFFAELLSRTGWVGQCVYPHFWVATSKNDPILIPATDPRLMSQVGTKEGVLLQIKAPGEHAERHVALHGPYLNLPKGMYRAELEITVTESYADGATIDVCYDGGRVELYERPCSAVEMRDGLIRMEFSLTEGVDDLEIRLFVPGGFSGSIKQLSLLALE
jgi:2-polyprenyl-3-methyl-5-hydroxy-6-metoxy-1,4-benzoquinol methylase